MESFVIGERVVLVGLRSAINLCPGVVTSHGGGADDVTVSLTAPPVNEVSVHRRHVLRANLQEDRSLIVQMKVLQRHLGLRIAYGGVLDGAFGGSASLLLLIASFVETGLLYPHQFTGFAGAVVPQYYFYDGAGTPRPFAGPQAKVEGSANNHDPRPRIDCGAAVVGCGQAAFAGGCSEHPNKAYRNKGFFDSACVYDSLFDEWSKLPSLRRKRHGASACCVNRVLFVLGGQYVETRSFDYEDDSSAAASAASSSADVDTTNGTELWSEEERKSPLGAAARCVGFCEMLDMDRLDLGWCLLPPSSYLGLDLATISALGSATFFPCAALGNRVVCTLEVEGVLRAADTNPEHGVWTTFAIDCEPAFRLAAASAAAASGVAGTVPATKTKLGHLVGAREKKGVCAWRRVHVNEEKAGRPMPLVVSVPCRGRGARGCAHGSNAFVVFSGRPSRAAHSASVFRFVDTDASNSARRQSSTPPREEKGGLVGVSGDVCKSGEGEGALITGPLAPFEVWSGESAEARRDVAEAFSAEMSSLTTNEPGEVFRGEWRKLPSLTAARGGGGVVSLHERVFAFGGCDESRGVFFTHVDELSSQVVKNAFVLGGSMEAASPGNPTESEEDRGDVGVQENEDADQDDDDDDGGDWWDEGTSSTIDFSWSRVPSLSMPLALHAHSVLALPRLIGV